MSCSDVATSNCSPSSEGRTTVVAVRMSASSWDLWKLFLSSPIVISIVVALVLALCVYVDHLLDLGSVTGTTEDRTGNDTVAESTEKSTGKDVEASETEEEEEDGVEDDGEDAEQFPLITLGPLYSWLMEENLLFEICELDANEGPSLSEAVAVERTERRLPILIGRPSENSDSERSNHRRRRELSNATVSFARSGREDRTGKIGAGSSSTDRDFPTTSDARRAMKRPENLDTNRTGHVMSMTEGKTQASDDIRKIPQHVIDTRFGGGGSDVRDDAASRCRRCFDYGASCDGVVCGAKKGFGCWNCDVKHNGFSSRRSDARDAGAKRLQQSATSCGDDCTWEHSQLRSELETERRLVESLTLQLARQTLALQAARERSWCLEDFLERLVMMHDEEETTPSSCIGAHPLGLPCDCGWNRRRRNPEPEVTCCCSWNAPKRAAMNDIALKHVAQSPGKKEEVDRLAEERGFCVEFGHCGTRNGQCRLKRDGCQLERGLANLKCCQWREQGLCRMTPQSFLDERRQLPAAAGWRSCCTEHLRFRKERGVCLIQQERAEVDQQKRQLEQRLCDAEQKWYPVNGGKCQMEQGGRCQEEERECQMERGSFQTGRVPCQANQRRCQAEKGQCQVHSETIGGRPQKEQLRPSGGTKARGLTESKLPPKKQNMRELERFCGKRDKKCTEPKPKPENDPSSSLHLEHQTPLKIAVKGTTKNVLENSTDSQGNRIEPSHVETSSESPDLTQCETQHFNDRPQTLVLAPNRTQRETSRDPDGRSGLGGISVPYDPDGGSGVMGSSNPCDPEDESELGRTDDPNDLDDEKGLRGTRKPGDPVDGTGRSKTTNPVDPSGESELRRSSNPYDPDTGLGIIESSNPYDPDTGSRVMRPSNPYDPDGGFGVMGSTNPYDSDCGSGVVGSSNPYDPDIGSGTIRSINPYDPDVGSGTIGSCIPYDPDTGSEVMRPSNPYDPDIESGVMRSTNPYDPNDETGPHPDHPLNRS